MIPNLNITLNESQYCKQCTPNVDIPKLGLIIQYQDQTEPHRIWGVTWLDLKIIKATLEGQLKYTKEREVEAVLKNELPRLEELLGVKLDDAD